MITVVDNQRDEKTWDMIQAAFAAADKVMTDRGWAAEDIDTEYMRRAIERLHTSDEGRDQLRAKVQAAASTAVDAIFFAMGEHADGDLMSLDRLVAYAAAEGQSAYNAKYKTDGDRGAAGFAWVSFRVDDERHQALFKLLRDRFSGEFLEDARPRRFRVAAYRFLASPLVQNVNCQSAACKAFAQTLRAAGFAPTVDTMID